MFFQDNSLLEHKLRRCCLQKYRLDRKVKVPKRRFVWFVLTLRIQTLNSPSFHSVFRTTTLKAPADVLMLSLSHLLCLRWLYSRNQMSRFIGHSKNFFNFFVGVIKKNALTNSSPKLELSARQGVYVLALTPEGVSRTLNYMVFRKDLSGTLFQLDLSVPYNRI